MDIETTLVILIGALGVSLANVLIDKIEQEECYKLQTQAQEGYERFYITNNQSEMCKAQEIIVDAPINN